MKKGDWFVYNGKNRIDGWFNKCEYDITKIHDGSKVLLCNIDLIGRIADIQNAIKHDTHFEIKTHIEIYVSYYTFESESELKPIPDGDIQKVFSTRYQDYSLELFEKNFTSIPSIMGYNPTRSIRMIKLITSNILE